jgi:hypothetical protein
VPKGIPGRAPCSMDGCDRQSHARQLCKKHHRRWLQHGDPTVLLHLQTATPHERIWRFIDQSGGLDACWPWTSSLNRDGYGDVSFKRKHLLAHRLAYEARVGAIPDGLQLDHLCRLRRCCNPAHLEPVTSLENNARGESASAHNLRKTHCIRGHAFDSVNTHITPEGHRRCRACMRMHSERRALVRGEATVPTRLLVIP